MFKLNGIRIQPGQPFTVGEGDDAIQYPSVNALTEQERVDLGITEEPDAVRPDDNLFWVTDNADGSFTATPRSAEDLQARENAKIKAQIDAIESAHPFTHRFFRDLVLVCAAKGLVPADHPVVAAAAAEDPVVAALRKELK